MRPESDGHTDTSSEYELYLYNYSLIFLFNFVTNTSVHIVTLISILKIQFIENSKLIIEIVTFSHLWSVCVKFKHRILL